MEHAYPAPRPAAGIPLKHWLILDTLTCMGFGTLLVAAAVPLAPLLGLPASLLSFAGLVLFPCAALMAIAARTQATPLIWLVVAGNAVWVAGSFGVAWMFETTGIGLAFLIVQAGAVGILATGEWRALNASNKA